ncbi:hypothetical protein ITJ66_16340 [Plantibacter sp. VKM Ac-2885]|uniref:hypothetical protein n=1 Tax=Plantibacter sp. VKM Ac-2885 TaxID=2783828 RepID=UPI00188A3C57|nr:hypothetical protein [Plantibacter sp. VKM Ac-2885]MBF4514055.1 hypothetical protein [Plantibacter sp. VKM Ac-2885]
MHSSAFIAASVRWPHLRPQEQAACFIAESVLDVTAWELDIPGAAPRTPDAELRYTDGRKAAFEVMTHARDQAMRLEAHVAKEQTWGTGSKRTWLLQFASFAEYQALKPDYEHIISVCDSHAVRMPEKLPAEVVWADDILRRFVFGSSGTLLGFETLPGEEPHVNLVLPGTGGVVKHSHEGLYNALQDAYATSHFEKHFEKLANSGYDERHLFVPIHYTAFDFEVIDGLQRSAQVPTSPPPARPEITHLWLVAQYGSVVWLWSDKEGWSRHKLPV